MDTMLIVQMDNVQNAIHLVLNVLLVITMDAQLVNLVSTCKELHVYQLAILDTSLCQVFVPHVLKTVLNALMLRLALNVVMVY